MEKNSLVRILLVLLLALGFSTSAFAATGWLSKDFYEVDDDPAYFDRSGEYINNFSVQYFKNEWTVSTNETIINISDYGELSKTNYTFVEVGISDGTGSITPSGYNSTGFSDNTLNITNITTNNVTAYAIVKGDWIYLNVSRIEDYKNATDYRDRWNLTAEHNFGIINPDYVYYGNETVQGIFSGSPDSEVYTYPNDLKFKTHTGSKVVNSPGGVSTQYGGDDTWVHYIDNDAVYGAPTRQVATPYYTEAKSWADANNVPFNLGPSNDLFYNNLCPPMGGGWCLWKDYEAYNSSSYGWGVTTGDGSNLSVEAYLKVDSLTSTPTQASWNISPRQSEYKSVFLNDYIDTFTMDFPINSIQSAEGLYFPDLDKSKDYDVFWDGAKQEHDWRVYLDYSGNSYDVGSYINKSATFGSTQELMYDKVTGNIWYYNGSIMLEMEGNFTWTGDTLDISCGDDCYMNSTGHIFRASGDEIRIYNHTGTQVQTVSLPFSAERGITKVGDYWYLGYRGEENRVYKLNETFNWTGLNKTVSYNLESFNEFNGKIWQNDGSGIEEFEPVDYNHTGNSWEFEADGYHTGTTMDRSNDKFYEVNWDDTTVYEYDVGSGMDARVNISHFSELTVEESTPNVVLESPANDTWVNGDQYFNFTATDNNDATLNCDIYFNGAQYDSTTAQNDTETGFLVDTSDLSDSMTVPWYVECTDDSGYSNTSETWYVDIDNTFPTVTDITPNDSAWLDTLSPKLSAYVSDNLGMLGCKYYIDGSLVNESQTLNMGGEYYNYTASVTEDHHNWSYECWDEAGNTVSEQRNFTSDVTDPWFNWTSPTDGAVYTDSNVTLNVTPCDNLDPSLDFNLTVNGTLFQGRGIGNGSATVNYNTYSDGKYVAELVVYDELHTVTAPSRTFTVDTTPPNIANMTPADNYITDEDIDFSFDTVDNLGEENCTLYVNGKQYFLPNLSESYQFTDVSGTEVTKTLNYGLGGYEWYVRCNDLGNTETTSNRSFYVEDLISDPDGDVRLTVLDTINRSRYYDITKPTTEIRTNEELTVDVRDSNLEMSRQLYRKGYEFEDFTWLDVQPDGEPFDLDYSKYSGERFEVSMWGFDQRANDLDWEDKGKKLYIYGYPSGSKIKLFRCSPYNMSSCVEKSANGFGVSRPGYDFDVRNNGTEIYGINTSPQYEYLGLYKHSCSPDNLNECTTTYYGNLNISGHCLMGLEVRGERVFVLNDFGRVYHLNCPGEDYSDCERVGSRDFGSAVGGLWFDGETLFLKSRGNLNQYSCSDWNLSTCGKVSDLNTTWDNSYGGVDLSEDGSMLFTAFGRGPPTPQVRKYDLVVYDGTVVLPNTYDKVFYCGGTYTNPNCEKTENYTEENGKTFVEVSEFSGVGGTNYDQSLATTMAISAKGIGLTGAVIGFGALALIWRLFFMKKKITKKKIFEVVILVIALLVMVQIIASTLL